MLIVFIGLIGRFNFGKSSFGPGRSDISLTRDLRINPQPHFPAEYIGIYDFLLTESLSRFGAPQPGKSVGIVGKTVIRHGNERLK